MNKRRLHHLWTKFRAVKPYYFLGLALASAVICLFALRANNQRMVVLRDAVYQADQNNGDIQGTLQDLRNYVYAHMNTNLSIGNGVYPPIQLKYTYDRLVQAQSDRLAQANAQIYTDAQHHCEQQNSADFSGRNRVPCIEQYVQSHGVKFAPIADALYKFNFVSPAWSPDLAGWSMFIAVLSLVLFLVSFFFRWWLKRHI